MSPLVARYDHVLLDLDGCVWVGEEATPGAVKAVAALRAAGKGVAFVTNDARLAGEEFVRKLWRLGFQASLEEVVTVGGALQFLLAERFSGSTAVVIGSPAVHRHVEAAGVRILNATTFSSRADVVVVAGHERFDYGELRTAVQAVLRGAKLVGAARDRVFPMADGPWPGSGALLAAVEAGSGRAADLVVGKPEPAFYAAALDRLGPGRVLGVGDRLDVDVAGAQAAGIDAALVLTGGATRGEAAAADPPPQHVAASLAELVLPQ